MSDCDPVDYSTQVSSVLHYFPEFAQIHVYWVGDAIHPPSPLLCPSPPASGSFLMSWLFASGQSIGASAWVLPMNSQGWFPSGSTDLLSVQETHKSLLQILQKALMQIEFCKFKNISSSVLSLLNDPNLTSGHNYWKNHSFDDMDLCGQSDTSPF